MKKKFNVEVTITATITIDERALARTREKDWRDQFHRLVDDADAAAHIGYNVLVNQITLTQIDGWADSDDAFVTVNDIDFDTTATAVKR